jgi:hypothetical protein
MEPSKEKQIVNTSATCLGPTSPLLIFIILIFGKLIPVAARSEAQLYVELQKGSRRALYPSHPYGDSEFIFLHLCQSIFPNRSMYKYINTGAFKRLAGAA